MQPGPELDFELPGLGELPPPDLTVPDAEPVAAPAPDPSKLAQEVAELRSQLSSTEQRLSDTQAWAQRQNAGRELYDALMAHRAAEQEQARRDAEAARTFAIPTLSDEEREALIADPNLLDQRITAVAGIMANRVYHSVMPRVAAAEVMIQQVGPLVDAEAARIAVATAQAEGLSEQEAAVVLPEARNALWQASKGDAVAYAKFCTNPEAVRWATRMARENLPAGVKPAPRGPSIGNGDQAAGRSGAGRSAAPSISAAAAKFARDLGITYSKEDLADVQSKLANKRR